jgi:hypothetical protein
MLILAVMEIRLWVIKLRVIILDVSRMWKNMWTQKILQLTLQNDRLEARKILRSKLLRMTWTQKMKHLWILRSKLLRMVREMQKNDRVMNQLKQILIYLF